MAGAGVAWWVYDRQTPGPATMGCATFEIVNVDLAPTSGFPTQADALHAFLATSAAAHLPHSGYSVPTQADLQAEVAASERESDVTPSVLMPTYWHKSHGKVDVQVDEEPNSNGWAVVSASACR